MCIRDSYCTESSEHNAEYNPFFLKADNPELVDQFNIPLDEYPRRCIKQIADWEDEKNRILKDGIISHNRSREYLKKALEYIHHNYVYDIHITDIAEHVGVDRTYLYRLFCAEKNLSPKQYLIRYRLHIAARLLKETDYTVTEIAYSCGFGDAPSFSRHFHSRFRMTPTAYRKQKEDPMLLPANR